MMWLRFAPLLLAIASTQVVAQGKPGSQFSWPSLQFSPDYPPILLARANEALTTFKSNKSRLGLPRTVDKLKVVMAADSDTACLRPSNFAYSNIEKSEIRLCKMSLINFIEYQYLSNFAAFIDPDYADRSTLMREYFVGLVKFFETQQARGHMKSGPCPAAYMAMLIHLKLDPNECFIGRIPHIDDWNALAKAGGAFNDPETKLLRPMVDELQNAETFDHAAAEGLLKSLKGKSNQEKIQIIYQSAYPNMLRGAIAHVIAHELGHHIYKDSPSSDCDLYKLERRAETFAYNLLRKADNFDDIPYSSDGTVAIKQYDMAFVLKDMSTLDDDDLESIDESQISKLKYLQGMSLTRISAFLSALKKEPALLKTLGSSFGESGFEAQVIEFAEQIDNFKICATASR